MIPAMGFEFPTSNQHKHSLTLLIVVQVIIFIVVLSLLPGDVRNTPSHDAHGIGVGGRDEELQQERPQHLEQQVGVVTLYIFSYTHTHKKMKVFEKSAPAFPFFIASIY